MNINHAITFITIVFAVIGLVFLNNIAIPSDTLTTNAAVIGFAVAPTDGSQPVKQGIISNINGNLVKNRGKISDEQKSKNLPIYIILNITFVTLAVTMYHKFSQPRTT